jgi:hypothetical protein
MEVLKELQSTVKAQKDSLSLQIQPSNLSTLVKNYGHDGQIPRLHWEDPKALELMKAEVSKQYSG